MTAQVKPSRRSLLKGSAAAALVVAIGMPARGQGATPAVSNTFGAFIRIGADGAIVVVTPCFEIGQGSQTGLAMVVADELGADWQAISVQTPPLDPVYRVPGRPVQSTSGSQMVRRWFAPLRTAAAVAREMLTEAAARSWAVDPAACTVRGGVVRHEASGRTAGFASLAGTAARLPQPRDPVLRASFTLVGTSARRLDIPGKVDGSAIYGIDVRRPDMVYAAIRQAPVFGAKLVSVAAVEAVRARRGVIDIVSLPDAVAVVADSFWRARMAVDGLDLTFSDTQEQRVDTRRIFVQQAETMRSGTGSRAVDTGRTPEILAAAHADGTLVESEFTVPFLAHASMEPMTCTAQVTEDACELWIPTQNLTTAAEVASKATGLPHTAIRAHATYAGGAFGRKFEQDFVLQAVLIAKAVRRPVQLIWSREEDLQHDYYRPAMSARLTGALAPDGRVAAVSIRIVGPSVLEHTIGKPLINGVDPTAMLGISTETASSPGKLQQYSIDNVLAEFAYQPTHVPVGYWRAVGASQNGFFIETFIDELATKAGHDPYQFRRRLLMDSPRALVVLDRAANGAGWGDALPAGRFRGIAFSECVGSFVAQVAEVSLVAGAVKVHRIVAAIDCGTAVNPDSVIAQTQGCIVMGLSAALKEEVTITEGRVDQSNFHDYEILRLADAPMIEVHVIQSGGQIGGAGEAGLPAVAPAVANALFAATGKRARSLPLRGFA